MADNGYYRNIGMDATAELNQRDQKSTQIQQIADKVINSIDPSSFSNEAEYQDALTNALVDNIGEDIYSIPPEQQEEMFGFVIPDDSDTATENKLLGEYARDPDDIADAEMADGEYQKMMKIRNDVMLDKSDPTSKDLRSQMLMRKRGVKR